jgi:hypothetical protein
MKLLLLFMFCIVSLASAQLGSSRQLIVSVGPDWNSQHGTIMLFEKKGGRWEPVGPSWAVMYADSGMAWGLGVNPKPHDGTLFKHEGDRRSPAGIFELGTLLGYDSAAPSGVRYPYIQSARTTRWVDDSKSKYYNKMIDEKTVPQEKNGKVLWRSAEHMKFDGIDYKYVIFVKHNAQGVPGKGSAIFLHLNSPQRTPTSGCTAMDEENMLTLLRWLDPAGKPLLVQLPLAEYQAYMKLWNLPALPDSMRR